jgi:hypothetical protein
MIEKMKYRAFSESEINLPVFSKCWWLDAVCGESNWDVAIVEKGNEIVASMPYFSSRKGGDVQIIRPPLTPCLGPYIRYPSNQGYYKKLSWERELMDELIEKLPACSFFDQHFHSDIQNWLPFYWKGYSQTTRYTYVVEGISFDEFWRAVLPKNRKRRIAKAEKSGVTVRESDDIEEFYALNVKTFERQGVKIPYSLSLLKRLFNEGQARGATKILVGEHEGQAIASSFLVKDTRSMYYLMGGIEPKQGDLGAMDLVQLKGIELALNAGLSFDFEGSMMESIEKYFRSFGAVQKPYFHVHKTRSKRLKVKRVLKDILSAK